MRTFEDIVPGETHEIGSVPVTLESIIAFATTYDPQPFHLDEAAGASSLLGGLSASGWQTSAWAMRLLYDGFVGQVASMGAPGVDEVRWLKPVRPGDVLSLKLTVEATRQSASRLDRGFVVLYLDLRNGAAETVMTQRFTLIVQRRDAPERQAAAPLPTAAAEVTRVPAADLMLTTFYDDVVVGHESVFGSQCFTPDLIVDFARLYDPQPFHIDVDAARKTHFGGLCASGWQTAAFWMKHYLDARARSGDARLAAGLPVAAGGPSPGFTDMKWLRPVRAGDSIRYGLRITRKRRSGRPGWAIISTFNTGHTSDGALAFSFDGRLMWPTEPNSTFDHGP